MSDKNISSITEQAFSIVKEQVMDRIPGSKIVLSDNFVSKDEGEGDRGIHLVEMPEGTIFLSLYATDGSAKSVNRIESRDREEFGDIEQRRGGASLIVAESFDKQAMSVLMASKLNDFVEIDSGAMRLRCGRPFIHVDISKADMEESKEIPKELFAPGAVRVIEVIFDRSDGTWLKGAWLASATGLSCGYVSDIKKIMVKAGYATEHHNRSFSLTENGVSALNMISTLMSHGR